MLPETRYIDLLPGANGFFRSPESFGVPEPIDGGEFRRRGLNNAAPRSARLKPAAEQPQLGMNDGFVIGADLQQIGPKALLDVRGCAIQRPFKIGMLRFHLFAIVGIHQRDAMLEGGLQLGDAAQELNLGGG